MVFMNKSSAEADAAHQEKTKQKAYDVRLPL